MAKLDKALDNAPEQVREFVTDVFVNARKVWDKPEDDSFVDSLLFVEETREGWQVSDNYERFFDTIYRYHEGQWFVRRMYSETPERPCSHESMLSTADILYTG